MKNRLVLIIPKNLMLWFLLRSFDKHLYNFSYKTEKYRWQKNITCYKHRTLLFINSGTTKSFKKKKTNERWTKAFQLRSMQGSNTVPARRTPALQPRSMLGSSKVPAKWALALLPHSMLKHGSYKMDTGTSALQKHND